MFSSAGCTCRRHPKVCRCCVSPETDGAPVLGETPQKLFEENPDILQPVARRNEMLARLKEGLQASLRADEETKLSFLSARHTREGKIAPPPDAAASRAACPQDVPISRTNFSWGVPMPGDEKHVIYVWCGVSALADTLLSRSSPSSASMHSGGSPAPFLSLRGNRIDALFNYVTALGLAEPGSDRAGKRAAFWPASIHVMAR